MKKVLAISLLLILLFNTGGYYFMFWALKKDAISKLNFRLDEDRYEDGETITVKIPLTLPYPISNIGYQRISGQYEHNGESFSLVKQKHENDTLYVVCIKNEKAEHYNKVMQQLVEKSEEQQNSFLFLTKFLGDYIAQVNPVWQQYAGWCMSIPTCELTYSLSNHWERIPSPPPEIAIA